MKNFLLLGALLLIAAPPAFSAKKTPVKKQAKEKLSQQASLGDLVNLVMKSGKEWKYNETIGPQLGYDVPHSGKKIANDSGSDGYKRVVVVTLDSEGKPNDLVFVSGKASKVDGVINVAESLSLRTDLKGTLISAVAVTAKDGIGEVSSKDVSDPAVKSRLDKELKFHLASTTKGVASK